MVRRASLLAVFTVAASVGCGNGDTSPAEFRHKTDAVCRKYTRLLRPFEGGKSPREVAAQGAKAEPIRRRGIAELRRIDAPDAEQRRYDAYLNTLEDSRTERAYFDAMRRGERRRAIRLLNEITREGERAAKLSRPLHLSRCFAGE